jgi:NAD(P)-dependent dehydrogenase (short-subunit alcohol dehydrogenase family)
MLAREPDTHGRRGSIINVASLLSFQGGLTVPAYAASKGGVAQLTKALSNEWASKGINVNAIAPGYIATEMNVALINDEKRAESILSRIPAGRWGSPDDFKGSVVFLASRASGYVSGEVLTVDGGLFLMLSSGWLNSVRQVDGDLPYAVVCAASAQFSTLSAQFSTLSTHLRVWVFCLPYAPQP